MQLYSRRFRTLVYFDFYPQPVPKKLQDTQKDQNDSVSLHGNVLTFYKRILVVQAGTWV